MRWHKWVVLIAGSTGPASRDELAPPHFKSLSKAQSLALFGGRHQGYTILYMDGLAAYLRIQIERGAGLG
jgi:hypothetical protein